jgi:acetylornithine deacetylase/succinyl-diaminopimelate desuccinylase-like protein
MLLAFKHKTPTNKRKPSLDAFAGRGSSDMKSGLAGMIHAAAAARDEGFLKAGRIGIVLVPDEETAGPRGSRDLDGRGLLGRDPVGMLTPEPTGASSGTQTVEPFRCAPRCVGRQRTSAGNTKDELPASTEPVTFPQRPTRGQQD